MAERARVWVRARRAGATLRAPFRLPHPPGDDPSGRIELEAGAFLGPHAWIDVPRGGRLRIGARTSIAAHFNVSVGANGSIDVGPGCVFSQNVTLLGTSHDIADWVRPALRDGTDPQMTWAMTAPEPVSIGPGCWIGVNAVVMPGVEIGAGSVVGANAVVTRSVPAFSVVAGVPARVLRSLAEVG